MRWDWPPAWITRLITADRLYPKIASTGLVCRIQEKGCHLVRWLHPTKLVILYRMIYNPTSPSLSGLASVTTRNR
jgi:hypothetical protein